SSEQTLNNVIPVETHAATNNESMTYINSTNSDNCNNVDAHINFSAKLYSYSDVPRIRAECIINDTNELLKIYINSEWRCLRTFQRLNTYIPPQEYLLGERQEFVNKNGVQVATLVPEVCGEKPLRNLRGNHKGISKCGAVYLSVPCLPAHFSSKLKETGVVVQNGNEMISIYFKLALVLGDNLGVHSILGFTESFNSSTFCRFCLTKKEDIHQIFDESKCVLRSKINYATDLLKNNVKLTGI
ncbi:hypothetical protein PV328_012431, partial [Microctonus aethiopoides]